MFKTILMLLVTLMASIALAQVDVNKADQAALDRITGIGPVMAKQILDERKKGGDFKDWNDLQRRVKGIGPKSAAKLSAAGLSVGGQKNTAPVKASKAAPVKAAPVVAQ